MIIRRANIKDKEELYKFNRQMYPQWKNCDEIVDFWLSRKSDEINNVVIMVDENDKIRGQQFFSSMSYYYNNETVESHWAFNLIVDEEMRKGSHGFALMWKCKKEHPNSMSSGSNDISMPINLKIGNKLIGHLKKYVGIGNPIWLATSLFRGEIKNKNFPESISVSGKTFKKNTSQELPILNKPYNYKLLEISRTKEFLLWKFYSMLHDYGVYTNADGDFFAVRTIVRKKITSLVLVDYRCKMDNKDNFQTIMQAFRLIASKMHLAVLIVGSSLNVTDQVCSSFKMKSVGRDRPILGFVNCKDKEKEIDNRNFVFLTLADSDGDVIW